MPRPAHLLLATACLAPVPAWAGVTWLCGLSPELTRIVCVADPDTVEVLAPGTAPSTAATTANVRGTRFPLDPQRVYSVDLWSPTTDADAAAFLARATICYRSPGCTVQFSAPMLQASAARQR